MAEQMRVRALGMAPLVLALMLSACARTPAPDPTTPSLVRSTVSTSTVSGEWVPASPGTLGSVTLQPSGVFEVSWEPTAGPRAGQGSWRIDSDGRLIFSLHTRGFGAPTASYRVAVQSDLLGLELESGDPWFLNGADSLILKRHP
jgi:hypothetical protein